MIAISFLVMLNIAAVLSLWLSEDLFPLHLKSGSRWQNFRPPALIFLALALSPLALLFFPANNLFAQLSVCFLTSAIALLPVVLIVAWQTLQQRSLSSGRLESQSVAKQDANSAITEQPVVEPHDQTLTEPDNLDVITANEPAIEEAVIEEASSEADPNDNTMARALDEAMDDFRWQMSHSQEIIDHRDVQGSRNKNGNQSLHATCLHEPSHEQKIVVNGFGGGNVIEADSIKQPESTTGVRHGHTAKDILYSRRTLKAFDYIDAHGDNTDNLNRATQASATKNDDVIEVTDWLELTFPAEKEKGTDDQIEALNATIKQLKQRQYQLLERLRQQHKLLKMQKQEIDKLRSLSRQAVAVARKAARRSSLHRKLEHSAVNVNLDLE